MRAQKARLGIYRAGLCDWCWCLTWESDEGTESEEGNEYMRSQAFLAALEWAARRGLVITQARGIPRSDPFYSSRLTGGA